MNKYAFFDLDYTVHEGYCTSDFINYLADKQIIRKEFKTKYSEIADKFHDHNYTYNQTSKMVLDLFAEAVAGFSEHEISVHSKSYSNHVKFYDYVSPILSYLNENNFEIAVVSAGAEIVVKAIAERINIDSVIATTVKQEDSKYLPVLETFVNADVKSTNISEITNTSDRESLIVAFGDSEGDYEMLEKADSSFLVNDHFPRVVEHAINKGWNITNDPTEIIELISSQMPV